MGIIYSPEEVMEDEHFRGRGFPVTVKHEDLGEVTYPGAPYALEKGGWAISRRAPRLGEHTEEVLAELGLGEELESLRAGGVVA